MTRRGPGLILCAALMLATAGVAAAPAESDAERETRARKHFIAAMGFMHAERNHDAITELHKAYAAWPDPLYVFMEAEAHWNMHEDAKALELYRTYRKASPHAANGREVDRRIEALAAGRHVESLKAGPPVTRTDRESRGSSLDDVTRAISSTEPGDARRGDSEGGAAGTRTNTDEVPGLFAEPAPAPVVQPVAETAQPSRVNDHWWLWMLLGGALAGGGAFAYDRVR